MTYVTPDLRGKRRDLRTRSLNFGGVGGGSFSWSEQLEHPCNRNNRTDLVNQTTKVNHFKGEFHSLKGYWQPRYEDSNWRNVDLLVVLAEIIPIIARPKC